METYTQPTLPVHGHDSPSVTPSATPAAALRANPFDCSSPQSPSPLAPSSVTATFTAGLAGPAKHRVHTSGRERLARGELGTWQALPDTAVEMNKSAAMASPGPSLMQRIRSRESRESRSGSNSYVSSSFMGVSKQESSTASTGAAGVRSGDGKGEMGGWESELVGLRGRKKADVDKEKKEKEGRKAVMGGGRGFNGLKSLVSSGKGRTGLPPQKRSEKIESRETPTEALPSPG